VDGALLVPQRSVTELQGSYQVAVVGADGRISIRPVTVGNSVGSELIISRGLRAHETVVAEGTQKVRPGMQVTVKPFSASATKG
jgi:membrane fusion protein (multidrug efflux system)